ncbi:hypothetical protein IQ07DRAFT_410102 [Pyrenochaeta sp. DS3sAY3a]|nr:hypothetical protein IQ07DRAFT_410102 [Pyrenochaeta sp. DS3sAY3a]
MALACSYAPTGSQAAPGWDALAMLVFSTSSDKERDLHGMTQPAQRASDDSCRHSRPAQSEAMEMQKPSQCPEHTPKGGPTKQSATRWVTELFAQQSIKVHGMAGPNCGPWDGGWSCHHHAAMTDARRESGLHPLHHDGMDHGRKASRSAALAVHPLFRQGLGALDGAMPTKGHRRPRPATVS